MSGTSQSHGYEHWIAQEPTGIPAPQGEDESKIQAQEAEDLYRLVTEADPLPRLRG